MRGYGVQWVVEDRRTNTVSTGCLAKLFKRRLNAEKAAQRCSWVLRPNGGDVAEMSNGFVVEVR